MITKKICNKCNLEKYIANFRRFLNKKNGQYYFRNACIDCEKLYKNTEKYKDGRKKYYLNNKESILTIQKKYHQENADTYNRRSSLYYSENKNNEEFKKVRRKADLKYKKGRIKKDPIFALKQSISLQVNNFIKINGVSKHFPFTIEQLKLHLESLFEPLMNWENRGKYNPNTWNDNDQTTWTWQIDHIIPHSTFNYCSVEDDDFKKCWALDNLRPYLAKQNILDGRYRIRHGK